MEILQSLFLRLHLRKWCNIHTYMSLSKLVIFKIEGVSGGVELQIWVS